MSRPKVSVIMTTYNCVVYIKRSCESLFRQTLKDIELLCIDGGSTDGTLEYIENLMEQDTRVRLYPEEGRGIGGAKNTGINYATGEYIAFLDADDELVNDDALKLLYEAAEKNVVSICGGLRSICFGNNMIEQDPLHRADIAYNPEGVLLSYRDRPYDYHFHCYIYSQSLLDDSEIRFAERLCFDDTHFFIRAMLKAEKFYVVPVEYYRYTAGPPYVWDAEHTQDAIEELIDQLIISKENNLSILHLITLDRINNEFSSNFIRHIREGNIEILRELICANEYVSKKHIIATFKQNISEGYFESMLGKSYVEMIHDYQTESENCVIIPLRMIMTGEDLKTRIKITEQSISYKIGRGITYIPRLLKKILKVIIGRGL